MGRISTAARLLRALGKKTKSMSTKQRKAHVDEIFSKKKKPKPLTEKQRVRFLMGHKMNYITGAAATAGAANQSRKRRKRQSVN